MPSPPQGEHPPTNVPPEGEAALRTGSYHGTVPADRLSQYVRTRGASLQVRLGLMRLRRLCS